VRCVWAQAHKDGGLINKLLTGVFVVAGTHVPSGSTGCMARPVKSMRFHKEKTSRFAGTLQGPADAAKAEQGAPLRRSDAQESDQPHAITPSEPRKDEPFLKPHPTVSAFESASELQYTVGTLGEGKRAYVDDDAVWAHVPAFLLGRPSIMTAVKDTASEGPLVSMFVDEPADVYMLLPAAEKTRKAKVSSAAQALSWLPFKLPSLLGAHSKETQAEKDDIPSWMQGEYHVVRDLTAVLTSGEKFDVWRKRVPVLGFLELGGNEGMTKGLKRGMYVAVLVPSSAANVSVEESLPLGFPVPAGSAPAGGGKSRSENGEEGGMPAEEAAHASGDKARGPSSLASAGKQHERGARGRRVRRHRNDDARESARHTRRGRQSIMKALVELKRRLARSHSQQASTDSAHALHGGKAQRRRSDAASGAGEVLEHVRTGERQAKGGRVAGGISADDLSDLVDRCHGRDEAGRCLVRAQACMSSRAMSDPANCQCFVDAVESFAASGASEGSCTASCMAAVEEAYNGHVMRVTGSPSPCL